VARADAGETRREAFVAERKQVKERGFLALMWPQLLVLPMLLVLWISPRIAREAESSPNQRLGPNSGRNAGVQKN
jgi:hypothetical protein